MYCGVPIAVPICVSAVPLAETGRSVPSSITDARLRLIHQLGQAPVDDQRLAVLAEHDVARLEVAVQHAAAVGVVDRVADVEEPAEQLPQLHGACAGVALSASGSWNRSAASSRLSPRMNRIA